MPGAFRTVLDDSFASLAPAVQALHAGDATATWTGRVQVRRGAGLLARLCARLASLPPTMDDAPVSVRFVCAEGCELWQRDFAGHAMHSRLRAVVGDLVESLGPLRFAFRLDAVDGAIHWRVRSVRAFALLPLPARWFAGVECREFERAGRYAFQVRAGLPLVGEVIAYDGWLEPN